MLSFSLDETYRAGAPLGPDNYWEQGECIALLEYWSTSCCCSLRREHYSADYGAALNVDSEAIVVAVAKFVVVVDCTVAAVVVVTSAAAAVVSVPAAPVVSLYLLLRQKGNVVLQ